MAKTTKAEISKWVRALLVAHGVKVVRFNDESMGLLNVSPRLSAVINDMHAGLVELAAGKRLPTIASGGKG